MYYKDLPTKMTSKKFTAVPTMNVTSHIAMEKCYNFNFKHEFECSKYTFWCYMEDTNLCIKFTILERCLHYLMITPRRSDEYL